MLDLRALTFMDTSGMQCIVDAASRVPEGRRLIRVRGPAHVDSLLTLTETSDKVDVLDLYAAEPPLQALLKAALQPPAVRLTTSWHAGCGTARYWWVMRTTA